MELARSSPSSGAQGLLEHGRAAIGTTNSKQYLADVNAAIGLLWRQMSWFLQTESLAGTTLPRNGSMTRQEVIMDKADGVSSFVIAQKASWNMFMPLDSTATGHKSLRM